MQEDERQLRRLIATWMQATEEGDVGTVLSLISEDAVFLMPDQAPMRKGDFAETQRAIVHLDFSIDYDIQEIAVSGDLAYCWNRIWVEIDLIEQGKTLRRAGNVLSVFRKEEGRWRMLRDANLLAETDGGDHAG